MAKQRMEETGPLYPARELVVDALRVFGQPPYVVEGARVKAGIGQDEEVSVARLRAAIEVFLTAPVERR